MTSGRLSWVGDKDWGREIYSGIKDTHRPAYLSLHAAVALGYMLFVSKQIRVNFECAPNVEKYLLAKQYGYEKSLYKGLESFNEISLTPLGETIILDLKSELSREPMKVF